MFVKDLKPFIRLNLLILRPITSGGRRRKVQKDYRSFTGTLYQGLDDHKDPSENEKVSFSFLWVTTEKGRKVRIHFYTVSTTKIY